MAVINSFFNFVKDSKDFRKDDELTCHALQESISNHPKLKNLIFDAGVDFFTFMYHCNKFIYGIQVTIFIKRNKDSSNVEKFMFSCIPFKHGSEQYYIILEDLDYFSEHGISDSSLDIKNYSMAYTVSKLTPNHPTIVDIIVNRFTIYVKIQHDNIPGLLYCNAMSSLKNAEEQDIFLESFPFFPFKRAMNILLKKVIGKTLEYKIDYELNITEACKILKVSNNTSELTDSSTSAINISDKLFVEYLINPLLNNPEVPFIKKLPFIEWIIILKGRCYHIKEKIIELSFDDDEKEQPNERPSGEIDFMDLKYGIRNPIPQNKLEEVFVHERLTFYKQFTNSTKPTDIVDIKKNRSEINEAKKAKENKFEHVFLIHDSSIFCNRLSNMMNTINHEEFSEFQYDSYYKEFLKPPSQRLLYKFYGIK